MRPLRSAAMRLPETIMQRLAPLTAYIILGLVLAWGYGQPEGALLGLGSNGGARDATSEAPFHRHDQRHAFY